MTSLFGGVTILPENAAPVFQIQSFSSIPFGQFDLTLTDFTYTVGGKSLWVFVNGQRQTYNVDYTETSPTKVTFPTSAWSADDVVEVVCFTLSNISAAADSAQANATAAAASAAAAASSAASTTAFVTAAANSATNAASSATAATNSASAAATSATAAAGSASSASTSATNASSSASSASTSATNAANSASSAATSSTNAGNSATAAAGSATSASTSAGTATTQAVNASTSATSAANSATAASGSASAAATSATNAANSATAAAGSATAASTSATNAATSAASAGSAEIAFVMDGFGLLGAGSKGFLEIPFNCTINRWTLLADVSGSIVVDIKKSTYSGFPTNSSITAAALPTLAAAQKAQSSTLTGWTTSITAGDILEFVVTGTPVSVNRVSLLLNVTRV